MVISAPASKPQALTNSASATRLICLAQRLANTASILALAIKLAFATP